MKALKISLMKMNQLSAPKIEKFTFSDALSWILNLKVFLKDQSMTDHFTMMSSLEDKVNGKAISTYFAGHQEQSKLDAYFSKYLCNCMF